eukprot:2920752-Amphidinium_carterae.2
MDIKTLIPLLDSLWSVGSVVFICVALKSTLGTMLEHSLVQRALASPKNFSVQQNQHASLQNNHCSKI